MKGEIIWFTTHRPNVEKLNHFFEEHKLEVSAYYSPIGEIYDTIRRLIRDEGLKVAIIRGGFAPELKKNISIPVVNVNQTVIDFYNLFPQIEKVSKKAALVGWYSEVRGLGEFLKRTAAHIRYVDLNTCGFTDYTEHVTEILEKLKKDGVDLIVSGGAVMEIAAKYGMNTMYVGLLDNETILGTTAEAQYQLRLLKEQESRFEFINSIFNCVSEGILAVNSKWEITNMNPIAARLLGVQPAQCFGEPLGHFLDLESLYGKLSEGKKVENQIVSIRDKRLVLNAVPSTFHDTTAGVVITLQQIDAIHSLEKKLRSVSAENGLLAKKSLDDIIGHNPRLTALKKKAMRYAVTDSTVLITGESGVGKELFAQGIHNQSARRNAPFVAINCAALPENLLESELFGYVRGAFTGARNEGKAGLFELANTGTIFLDEISETALNVQIRLLRVLQERSVIRIGGSSIIPLDVRVIAATNRNLKEYIREGRFRQDLYYRLCVLPLHVMPLRERREDILEIIYYMLRSKNNNGIRFAPEAETVLIEYDWPGNVRELTNFVERILVLHDKDLISENEVREALFVYGEAERIQPVSQSDMEPEGGWNRENAEKQRVWKALTDNNWNRKKAADQLGISTTTLWRKIKKWDFLGDRREEEQTKRENDRKTL